MNFLGARVYQLEPDPKLAQDLLALASEMKAKSFFALEQGCYYFAAYAHYWAGRDREAKLAISAAYSLGLSHRLRENLMLDLLALQIGNAQKSLDQLQIEVRQQAHAVYWDQINFLQNSDTSLASLLLHNSKNIYAEKALSQLRLSSPLYVRIAKAGPEILKPTQVHKLRESSEFPTLEIGGKTLSLPKILTPQSLDILETILRRQDFGIREAELWEKAWRTMFTASSSDAIRKAVERLRKTEELKGLVEIKSSKQRYFAAPVGSAKFTFQNS
ncbi:MAG: hypothetical protein EOP05_19045 [Proteobacteria bacterium]|nr:MAG: hypothetical protein EOP05_19045 [Pseudomonadota bacterium]